MGEPSVMRSYAIAFKSREKSYDHIWDTTFFLKGAVQVAPLSCKYLIFFFPTLF